MLSGYLSEYAQKGIILKTESFFLAIKSGCFGKRQKVPVFLAILILAY